MEDSKAKSDQSGQSEQAKTATVPTGAGIIKRRSRSESGRRSAPVTERATSADGAGADALVDNETPAIVEDSDIFGDGGAFEEATPVEPPEPNVEDDPPLTVADDPADSNDLFAGESAFGTADPPAAEVEPPSTSSDDLFAETPALDAVDGPRPKLRFRTPESEASDDADPGATDSVETPPAAVVSPKPDRVSGLDSEAPPALVEQPDEKEEAPVQAASVSPRPAPKVFTPAQSAVRDPEQARRETSGANRQTSSKADAASVGIGSPSVSESPAAIDVGDSTISTGGGFGELVDDADENRSRKRLQTELTFLFNMFDRLMMMMRVYPNNHPLVDDLSGQVLDRFAKILDREEGVLVRIGPKALATEYGDEFFSAEISDKNNFDWYAAYADGLIHFKFLPGLTAVELQHFIRVINRTSQNTLGLDDDAVTILWELQLVHIEYFAVEGFVEGGQAAVFGDFSERDATKLVAEAALSPRGEDAEKLRGLFQSSKMSSMDFFTRMELEASSKLIPEKFRENDVAFALGVEEEVVQRLREEWTHGFDLEYRLIEAILSIIRIAPGSDASLRAAQLIDRVTRQLIESENFLQALHILQLLQDRRELFANSTIDPLRDLIEQLSRPMQLEALLNVMQKAPQHREAVGELLVLLSHDAVQIQILSLLSNPNREVAALTRIVDILMRVTHDDNRENVYQARFTREVIYITRILDELGRRDFEGWSPTRHLLRVAIEHSSPEIQLTALGIKHSFWRDERVAATYLVPLCDDQLEDVRRKAFELLGETHPDLFRKVVRQTILAHKFGVRNTSEIRFMMRSYMRNEPTASDVLRGMADVSGWKSQEREFAKLAVSILLESGDEGVKEVLFRRSRGWFVAPELKRSYASIIEHFDLK